MKLTPEQLEKIKAFLNSRWQTPTRCGCCGANNWSGSEQIFQLIQFSPGGITLGGPVVPLIPLTCNNCGNTLLINAIISGIVEPKKPEEKKDAK